MAAERVSSGSWSCFMISFQIRFSAFFSSTMSAGVSLSVFHPLRSAMRWKMSITVESPMMGMAQERM